MNGNKISRLYRNEGSFQFTQIMGLPFDQVDSGDSAFSDVDDDGDQDLLISGLDSNGDNVLKLYLNDGLGSFTEVVDAINIPSVWLLEAFDFADVDGDGDQDVLLTGYNPSNFSRITTLWENLLYNPVMDKSGNTTVFIESADAENAGFGEGFTLYPNPTDKGYTNITSKDLSGEVKVMVSDAFGRQVLSRKMNVQDHTLQLDVEILPAGMYIIKVQQGEYSLKTKLIVK